jgi:peptide-methionine (S)-S-oxide reductase
MNHPSSHFRISPVIAPDTIATHGRRAARCAHTDARRPERRVFVAGALAALLCAALAAPAPALAGEGEARMVPPFAGPEPKAAGPAPSEEVAVLAGGCFWGVQAVFQHLDGVTGAVSGYAGGDRATAVYPVVGSGTTGHAESVQVRFDPRRIGYARILQVFFSVAHDPTQLDRQGPDHGPQYRSAIFPADENQARIARAYIAQLERARVFDAPIATRIEEHRDFFPAEDYHQDFLARHPTHPYIVVNDLPKLDALKRLFPAQYRATPVLVAAQTVGKR